MLKSGYTKVPEKSWFILKQVPHYGQVNIVVWNKITIKCSNNIDQKSGMDTRRSHCYLEIGKEVFPCEPNV